NQEGRGVLRWIGVIALVLSLHLASHRQASASRTRTPRSYARMLVLKRWHTTSEWRAADAIVRPESSWDPCEHYPSTHDCRYTGSSSCGIPQANPCPLSWRGRLFQTRWAQV